MTVLTPVAGQVSLDQLADIYWYQRPVILNSECRPAVQLAADQIAAAVGGGAAFYGVNTGFGKLASVKIAAGDTETLQRNLILSHCCGVGEATPRDIVRLMMALKLISFGRGASGVRWALIEVLQNLLLAGVTPIVSAQGSVGASGDLAPLAHLAAVLIGEGQAKVDGQVMPGAEALKYVGLTPLTLRLKEGLALINGTQFSTAFALAGVFEAWRAAQNALVTSALSTDAIMLTWDQRRQRTLKFMPCAAIAGRSRRLLPSGRC